MVMHICTNCSYRFNSENPNECPYCGEDKVEIEKDASELLDEVEKLLRY